MRHLRDALHVVLRAGGDDVEDDVLGGAAAQRHAHGVGELLLRVQRHVTRQRLRVAERGAAPRHNAHLHDRVCVLEHPAGERVPRLVEGHHPPLVGVDGEVLLLQARDDAVDGAVEGLAPHALAAEACGDQRRLVAHVGHLRAREAGRERGELLGVVLDVALQLERREVHAEDLSASLDVRLVDAHLPVEASRAQQRLVEDVRSVGWG